jgi:hypothetical protein
MSEDTTIEPRPDRYWPTVEASDLGTQIHARYVEYLAELERRGMIELWQQVQDVYDGYDSGTGSFSKWVTESGEQGEFLNLHVNEFASLVRHQLILTTSEKLEFEAIAGNDSPEAEAQASIGKQAIRSYQRQPHNVEALLVKQAERMLLFGAGYMTQLWDAHVGADVAVEEAPVYGDDGKPLMQEASDAGALDPNAPMPPSGQQESPAGDDIESAIALAGPQPVTEEKIRKSGDLVHRVYAPIDVARDLGVRGHEDVRWYIIRERVNKYELAARFPEHAPYITERPAFDVDETSKYERKSTAQSKAKTDEIHVLRLFHAKTDAVPQGIEALCCGTRVLGPIMPLVYARMPVHTMVPQEVMDTSIPRAMNWDLLGPQAAYNAAVSNGITSSDAGSVPKWAIERKSNVNVETLGPNMRAAYYDANPQAPNSGMPTLLQTPSLNDSHLKQIDAFRQILQILSGVNAVVRGQSEGKSGADNALISAQAVQYLSGYARAFQDGARSWGLGTIETLQRFARDERLLRMFGEDESWSVSYFTSDDLSDITDVDVDLGDAAMRTIAQKRAVASELLERFPQQITPEQYLAFIANGRLEPLYKAQRNQVRLIRAENAKLAKGEAQPVIKTDCHEDHIKEHLAVLSTPAIRADDGIVRVILAHVAEHNFMWTMLAQTEPSLLAATGQRPPPPPPMMMGPPGMAPGGPPPPGGAPPPGGPPDAQPGGGGPRAKVGGREEMGGVPLPQAPKNAATGEPAPMPAPGGGMQ